MHGGEIFVPKIPSMNIGDLAKAIAGDCRVEQIGIRPGEKLHEVLISEDEARHTLDCDRMFVIQPHHPWWTDKVGHKGQPLADGYTYSSHNNTEWLGLDDLRALLKNEAAQP
jgi:UDP-N-acetylglucosamine 4,6-dehydratase